MWELDHVFTFVEPDGSEIARMADLGFTETYRRDHPGQGTSNVCYAFDNLYVELIWLTDTDEARSEAIRRTRLYERSRWRTEGTCPFGIAWRPAPANTHGDLIDRTWDYRPPYLATGDSIQVAIDSDDPRQPMMFHYPGSSAPIAWPSDRRGQLQDPGGLRAVSAVSLSLPSRVEACPALNAIENAGLLQVASDNEAEYSAAFTIRHTGSAEVTVLRLPMV